MDISSIDLIRCFSQGEVRLFDSKKHNNSAPIAFIKACIEIFGYDNVIQYTLKEDIYYVILKNGETVTFNTNDLHCSNYVANFQFNTVDPGKYALYQKLIIYAQLLQCTMAVMLSKTQNIVFDNALSKLNSSISPFQLPPLLGLENYYKGKNYKQCFMTSPAKGMIAWFNKHFVYMSEERYDNNGAIGYFVNRYPLRITMVKNKR